MNEGYQQGLPGVPMQQQGMGMMQPQYGYQQPQQPQYGYQQPQQPQQQQKPKRVTNNTGTITHTGSQLFEIQGGVDITDKFPEALAFVMAVPSQPDSSKKSGKTYVMEQKIIVKCSTEELYSLAYALEEAALYGRCTYTKFSDPTKAGGTGDVKKIQVVGIVEGEKTKVFVNVSSGNNKISMPLDKYTAAGLAGNIRDIARATNEAKFEQEKINREYYKNNAQQTAQPQYQQNALPQYQQR